MTVPTDYPDCLSIHRPIHAQHGTDTFRVTIADDIHGVAATTLAGIIAAAPKTKKSVDQHTYLIAGAGETGHGIGEMIAEYIARETRSTIPEARRKIWMVDTGGLVTRLRAEKEDTLALHKLPYAHDGAPEVRIGPFPNPKSKIQAHCLPIQD